MRRFISILRDDDVCGRRNSPLIYAICIPLVVEADLDGVVVHERTIVLIDGFLRTSTFQLLTYTLRYLSPGTRLGWSIVPVPHIKLLPTSALHFVIMNMLCTDIQPYELKQLVIVSGVCTISQQSGTCISSYGSTLTQNK